MRDVIYMDGWWITYETDTGEVINKSPVKPAPPKPAEQLALFASGPSRPRDPFGRRIGVASYADHDMRRCRS